MEMQFEHWQITTLTLNREESVFAVVSPAWMGVAWVGGLQAPIYLLQIGVKGIYRFTMKALTWSIVAIF